MENDLNDQIIKELALWQKRNESILDKQINAFYRAAWLVENSRYFTARLAKLFSEDASFPEPSEFQDKLASYSLGQWHQYSGRFSDAGAKECLWRSFFQAARDLLSTMDPQADIPELLGFVANAEFLPCYRIPPPAVLDDVTPIHPHLIRVAESWGVAHVPS